MARYRIVHWRDIPSLVEASDGQRSARRSLSPRFQDLIDAVAMREGASESAAYLEGWEHGPERERPGDPEAVADEVASELEAAFEEVVARRLLAGGGPAAR
jgi:cvfA/B/C family virulence factor